MYNYGYETTYTDYDTASTALGIFAAIYGIIGLISLVIGIIAIISQWKIYKKAGKPGWASIVPIYNFIVLLEIVELPMWYIALLFVPIANIYAMFKIYIELAHKFGKSTGFGVATVFFNFICLPILAFNKNCVYNGINNTNNMSIPNTNQENFSNNNPYINENNNSNIEQPISFNPNMNTSINQMSNNINNIENNTTNIEQNIQLPINNQQNINQFPETNTQSPMIEQNQNIIETPPIQQNIINNEINTVSQQPEIIPQTINTMPNLETNSQINNQNLNNISNYQPQQVIPPIENNSTNNQPISFNQQPIIQPAEVPKPLNVIPNMGPTIEPQIEKPNNGNNQFM